MLTIPKSVTNLRKFFLVSVIALLTGCLGPKKMNKWVAKNYPELPALAKNKTNFLTINSNVSPMSELSYSTKKTSKVLPLIVYWQFDYKVSCALNPQIAISSFTASALANASKLKPKLNNQSVELTIEKIPTNFAIDDKAHIIWIIYAIAWDKITVIPLDKEMIVSYKVVNSDHSIAKTGSVTLTNTDEGIPLGMFQSLKKKTWEYLDQYEESISSMTKTVIQKIAEELP
jgi:hypothetical protein